MSNDGKYFYNAQVSGGEVIEVTLKGVIKNPRHATAVALNHYIQNLQKLYGPYLVLDVCQTSVTDGVERSILLNRRINNATTEQRMSAEEVNAAVAELLKPNIPPPPPEKPSETESVRPYKLGVW